MKVCVIGRGDIQIFPPLEGGANKIFHTLKHLSLLGIKVYYVTSEYPYYFEIVKGKFRKKFYPMSLRRKVNIKKIQEFIRKFLGIPKEETILFHPLFNLQLIRKVFYVIKKENPEILQAEFLGFGFPFIFVKLFYKIPTVLVEHNVECMRMKEIFPSFKRGLFLSKLIECFIAKISDIVITSTEEDKKRLRSLGINKNKIIVIPHGVEVEKFKKGKREKIRKKLRLKYTTLVFHGVLSYKPNLWCVDFIREKLIPYLRKRNVKFHVLVIGNYYPKNVKEKEMIFTGAVENLEDYLTAADIAVVPLKAGGGMRIKILEYFASKKPVVSTPKGVEGIPVRNKKEVIISSLRSFNKEVLRVILSKKLRRKLVENSSKLIKKYEWEKICREYLRVYQTLLK